VFSATVDCAIVVGWLCGPWQRWVRVFLTRLWYIWVAVLVLAWFLSVGIAAVGGGVVFIVLTVVDIAVAAITVGCRV
jgi:hypothetical protein